MQKSRSTDLIFKRIKIKSENTIYQSLNISVYLWAVIFLCKEAFCNFYFFITFENTHHPGNTKIFASARRAPSGYFQRVPVPAPSDTRLSGARTDALRVTELWMHACTSVVSVLSVHE